MKTYQEIYDALEEDATQRFLAYAAVCRVHPDSPDRAALRKRWQEASKDLRDLMRHMKESGVEPGHAYPDVADQRKAS